jgi:hypothetical protein
MPNDASQVGSFPKRFAAATQSGTQMKLDKKYKPRNIESVFCVSAGSIT